MRNRNANEHIVNTKQILPKIRLITVCISYSQNKILIKIMSSVIKIPVMAAMQVIASMLNIVSISVPALLIGY